MSEETSLVAGWGTKIVGPSVDPEGDLERQDSRGYQ